MASKILLSATLIAFYQNTLSDHPFFGHVPVPEDERPSFVRDESQIAENRISIDDIAESLDWRDYQGKNYMPPIRNQHIPQYCGSCWVFSASTAFAARIMIKREDVFPSVQLSPQLILDCDDTGNYGCSGGDASLVMRYFAKYGAVEDSCSPYLAESWYESDRECNDYSYCSYTTTKDKATQQYAYSDYPKFYVDEYDSTTSGEEAMLKLLQEGPIVCSMAVDDDFYDNYDGGIYYDKTNYKETDHEIVIAGYGYSEEEDLKFWIVANSWGTSWGEDGYFRIVRGVNNLAIEEYCVWATVKESSLDSLTGLSADNLDSHSTSKYHGTLGGGLLAMKSSDLTHDDGHKTSPLPEYYLKQADLPKTFGWHEYDNKNLINVVRQTNMPYRCDSCWAFAIAEIISDRINIMNYFSGTKDFQQVNLSPQVLINEVSNGDCDGGYAADAMKYLYTTGVPDESCQNYMAKSKPHSNTKWNICYSCDPDFSDPTADCYAIDEDDYNLYTVQEYGYISGVKNMKAEIYARGPIACSMYVDTGFQNYESGIYSSDSSDDADYMVTIIGWGYDEDEDTSYWIGKNQWGVGWGLDGYFKMELGVNSNGIEDNCMWGVPTWDDELKILTERMNSLTDSDKLQEDKTEHKEFSWLHWMTDRLPAMSLA